MGTEMYSRTESIKSTKRAPIDPCSRHNGSAANQTISTIGYEGTDLPSFIDALKSACIEVLIDIRELPLSRKRGFSKNQLSSTLTENGIRYVHLRGLGDPKEGRLAARSGDYQRFRKVFLNHMQSAGARADLLLAIALVEAERTCLMCFEADETNCHRRIVAQELATATGVRVNPIRPSPKSLAQRI
jgi:uncharacterized protein (DUF488 family)